MPILLALVLRGPSGGNHGRLYRHNATHEAEVSLAFIPYAWHSSDEVRITLAQRGETFSAGAPPVAITDSELKRDPKRAAIVSSDDATSTGAVWTLARVPTADLRAQVLIVAKTDTEWVHGRWRLRSSARAAVPAEFEFLFGGVQAGTL